MTGNAESSMGSLVSTEATPTESPRRCCTVTFGDIQVREFERICGDNPAVSDRGPPLAIGWGYNECGPMSVDCYERERCCNGHKCEPLKGEMRRNILQYGFSVPSSEIRECLKEVERVQKEREKTIKQGKVAERFHNAFRLGRGKKKPRRVLSA